MFAIQHKSATAAFVATTAAALAMSFCFAAASSQVALAQDGRSHIGMRSAINHSETRTGRPLRAAGHTYTGPGHVAPADSGWSLVPGKAILDDDCNLPTSACPNEMRDVG